MYTNSNCFRKNTLLFRERKDIGLWCCKILNISNEFVHKSIWFLNVIYNYKCFLRTWLLLFSTTCISALILMSFFSTFLQTLVYNIKGWFSADLLMKICYCKTASNPTIYRSTLSNLTQAFIYNVWSEGKVCTVTLNHDLVQNLQLNSRL